MAVRNDGFWFVFLYAHRARLGACKAVKKCEDFVDGREREGDSRGAQATVGFRV
jgi:hypothetical protein